MNHQRALRLILALTVFALAAWLLRGYFTDDTLIHLRYARHLLERGEFSFNPGQATYGVTSPVWVMGLALLMKLGIAPLTAAWLLGAVCGLMALLVAEAILNRFTFPERWKTLFLVAVVWDPWFLRWTFSGMETPLATLMLLVLLWPLVSGRDQGWGVTREPLWQRYLGWGAAAGLAGLVRPEFLVLAPLALPLLLWFEYYRGGTAAGTAGRFLVRPQAPLAAAAGGWCAVVAPWLAYSQWSFGRILPETAAAKAGSVVLDPLRLLENFTQAVRPLAAVQGFYWAGTAALVLLVLARNRSRPAYPGRYEVPDQAAGAAERGQIAVSWSVWGPVAMVGIAVVWAAVLLGGYAVRQVWVISRYVSPLAPVLMMAMSLMVEWLLGGSSIDGTTRRAGRKIILVAVTLTFCTNLWVFTTGVLPHARQFPRDVKTCYWELGDWLRENTSEDAVVAALDIGAVGYSSERTILDLMGLVSPEILELGGRLGFAAMVESGAWLTAGPGGGPPHYLVDRTDGPPRWQDRTVDGVSFELLRTCTLRGVGLREPQPWTVALYRLSPTATRVRSSAGG